RVPAALLKRKAALAAIANAAWIEARATSNFALFKPHLEEIVGLARAYADAIGYAEHPYDALVSIFEPGETVASLKRLFATLRTGIRPLLDAVRDAREPRADFLERDFPEERQ